MQTIDTIKQDIINQRITYLNQQMTYYRNM